MDGEKQKAEDELWQKALQNAYDGKGNFIGKKVIKDTDGNLILVDKTDEEMMNSADTDERSEHIRRKISEMEKYLNDTDWYVSRKAENGKEIPPDVSERRDEYRIRISEYRELVANAN